MIAVLDYGRGNLGSVEQAFARVGIPAAVTDDPRIVDEADAVVLPGDGAFHDAMANLERLGLLPPLRRALAGPRPFLGICLGYQLLFSASEEFGEGGGLDIVRGMVRRFPAGRKVPHMGWNRVFHGGALRLFDGIPEGAQFYFVHSYYPVVAGVVSPAPTEGGLSEKRAGSGRPDLARSEVRAGSGRPDLARSEVRAGSGRPDPAQREARRGYAIAWCDYGIRFAAALEHRWIHATQFHPEKSQRWGLRLLENFAALVKESTR